MSGLTSSATIEAVVRTINETPRQHRYRHQQQAVRANSDGAAAADYGASPSSASLLTSRLQQTMETIEKEYAEFNLKHAARKQRRIVPKLFYVFYTSSLCTNFVAALFDYLQAFLAAPLPEGVAPTLDADVMRSKPQPTDATAAVLHSALLRVSDCWSGILMYRASMNQYETITVSTTMKKSEHFLNDTFDAQFYETLYLLVEYLLESQFLEATRAQHDAATSAAHSAASAAAATDSNSPNAIATDAGTTGKANKATASAATIAASVESNWRTVQHELQRLLRSRNFSFSSRRHTPGRGHHLHAVRGNGLNHAPLGLAPTASGSGSRKNGDAPKNGTSYRDPKTFTLFGVRRWNDPPPDLADLDDTRALSHLPGQFHTRGQQGILECLDLRSPLVCAVLPTPHTTVTANSRYVFGTEERRAMHQRKYHGRLTRAEERYLAQQHARQQKREAEWKVRLEREAREEIEKEEEDERRRSEEQAARRLDDDGLQFEITEEKEDEAPPASAASATLQSPPQLLQPVPPLRFSLSIPPLRTLPSPPSLAPSSSGQQLSARPPSASTSRSARLQSLVAGSQTTRSNVAGGNQLAPLPPRSMTARRRTTLDEQLASTAPLIKLDGNRISLRL